MSHKMAIKVKKRQMLDFHALFEYYLTMKNQKSGVA
jgi:hypothetical protein